MKPNLRPLNLGDHEFWNTDSGVKLTLSDFENLINELKLEEKQNKSHSFILDAPMGPVGFIQVFNILKQPANSGMIDIMISRSKRNMGYGKRGISLLEEFCFNHLHLMRLIAPISPENEHSKSLFKSMGYQMHYIDHSAFFFDKKPVSHEIWVKIRKDLVV